MNNSRQSMGVPPASAALPPALVLVLALLLPGAARGAPDGGAAAAALPAITVRAVAEPQAVSLDGMVEAVRQSSLSAQVPGAIVALMVKAGDRVRAGQPLMRIDSQAAQQAVSANAAQVEVAQAQVDALSSEYRRQSLLLASQFISQAALDRTAAQLDGARATVRALQAQTRASQAQTGFFVVSAPYAGVVSDVPVALGDMVTPGRPLVTLYDPSALRVVAAVPQGLLGAARDAAGVRYELGAAGPERVPPAGVQLIPALDAVTHTAQLRLAVPSGRPEVVPGMSATVWLAVPSSGAAAGRIFVPAPAIVRRGELVGVYVLDPQGLPRLRQVRAGVAHGDQIEILSGVSSGERVVTAPSSVNRIR